jgi:thiol-disulfide isomerase/thioredoxin
MKRGLSVVLVLVGLQGLLVLAYLVIEGTSEREAAVEAEPLDRPSPALRYRTFDGAEHHLDELRGTPVLVHFWATWCPPCREELPALLDFAASSDVRILAVSVDREWDDIREFLHGDPPPEVVLATSPVAAEQFGVETLPESYLVDARGRLRLRFAGARDWTSSSLRGVIHEGRNNE